LVFEKNANFFTEFFGENIFKIITSVTGRFSVESPAPEQGEHRLSGTGPRKHPLETYFRRMSKRSAEEESKKTGKDSPKPEKKGVGKFQEPPAGFFLKGNICEL
jgi:hypothetical protein